MKPEAILIPLLCALLAGAAAVALGRAGLRRTGLALAAGGWVATLAAVLAAEVVGGWDGLAVFAAALFVLLPAATGLTLGLWLGLRLRRRRV